VRFSVSTSKAFGNIKHNVDRCLSQTIDQTGVPSQFYHFMSITDQDIPDGIDRFLNIEFFVKIYGLIFLMGKIFF
jgi:hypothetical protein